MSSETGANVSAGVRLRPVPPSPETPTVATEPAEPTVVAPALIRPAPELTIGMATNTLQNIQNAILIGLNGTTFDLRGWSGTDILNVVGGQNPVVTHCSGPNGSSVVARRSRHRTTAPVSTARDM